MLKIPLRPWPLLLCCLLLFVTPGAQAEPDALVAVLPTSFWTMARAVAAMVTLLVACIILLLWRYFSMRRLVRALRTAAQQNQQADSTIETLVESMVGVTGQECLDHITAGLCAWLRSDCCMLGEFIADQKVKTLSMQLDGEKIANITYALKGSPCASVVRDGYCLFSEKVREHFPDNPPLAAMRAEGYVGTQVRDRQGRVIGILTAISRQPMTLPKRIQDAMNILAARAGAEIDRHRTEKALAQELTLNRGVAELSSQLLATTHDIGTLARLILDKAMALTGCSQGYVSSIDPKTGDNIVHTFTDIMNGCRLDPAEKRVVFSRGADGLYPGIWGHALNTGVAFYTNAPTTHAAATGVSAGHLAIDRVLSVPVLFGQELLGQITLANPARDFTDHDLKIIARVADLYALTLLNQRADEARERLTAELRHAQKLEAIGTLAGGIAHDFNNILSAIMGYTELAKDELPAPSQAGKDLDEVMLAARRARDLVKQLLTFSRQTDQEMRPLQLVLLLKEACKLLRSSVPSSIDIKQKLDLECGQVLADPTQIHQLLLNLATNSVQAMGDKGRLTITLQEINLPPGVEANRLNLRPGVYVCLSVADTGPGMDQATMARIFEPFFTTRQVGRGSGMGLPVALGIAQKHKGAIGVESNPGQGATFHVYFPIFHEETEGGGSQEGKTLPIGTERILFVDDEDTLSNMGKQLLERQGYQVTTLTDSSKALELIRSDPTAFDLVITDQTMPGLSGLELAREIVTIRPDLPIILCSGYSVVKPEPLHPNTAVREFLLKPLERGAIARTVRRVLDNC